MTPKKNKLDQNFPNNSELNTFFEKLWTINLKEKTTRNNLSHKQRQALKIQEKEDIIIKETNKYRCHL